MVVRLLLIGLFALSPVLASAAASLEARVDRSVLREGETLVLELIQREESGEPDVSALLTDFDVLSTSRSSQMTVVNGSVDSYTTWRYTLSPLRSGTLTIPALSSGSVSSEPLQIKVEPGNTSGADNPREIFIEVSVDNERPYVQSQIIYTVKIFRARDFFDASLTDPKTDDLVHQRLGEDTRYKLQRDGIRYTVIQRRYVLFPQKSGEIVVPPLVLSATVANSFSNQGSFGGLVTQGRPVRLRSESITLDVQPAAAGFTGQWWLPAKTLTVSENWSDGQDQLQVGVPVTRTITVQAEGILRGQLPKLSMPQIDGLKIYTDQPELGEKSTLDGLIGKHTERWAIIPSKPGNYEMPELTVSWWDVQNNKQVDTVLPARTISVAPVAGGAFQSNAIESAKIEPTSVEVTSIDRETAAAENTGSNVGWVLLVVALIAGWVLTTIIMWRKIQAVSRTQISKPRKQKNKGSIKQLRAAVASGNSVDIKDSLLSWAVETWPDDPPRTLTALAVRLDDTELSPRIRALDAAMYSKNSNSSVPDLFDLVDLLANWRKEQRRAGSRAEEQALPDF